MKKVKLFFCLTVVTLFSTTIFSQANPPHPIEGRWDISISQDGKEAPSWLEVIHSGNHALVGYFVGISGSARPISVVKTDGAKFNFAIPPQWEKGTEDLKLEGTVEGSNISGTINMPDAKTYSFKGVRAPKLKAQVSPKWQTPAPLFNGKDLKGWTALGNTNQWIVADGILRSPKSGANIRTDETFTDFKLHIEFRYPKESNSGVYLRGRYEVQVSDNKDAEPTKGDYGAIYGFIQPTEMAAKAAGEWQSYDITLIGRKVTVVANGKTIISGQEIPGITGGALDSKENEPGPIMIQGYHGPVEYRNITISKG